MRILVIEDETHLREQITQQLQKQNLTVDAAKDGEEGLYFGSEYAYDVAIIDLGLPKLSGIQVIQELRLTGKEFPILILTARGRWQDKVEGLEAGADDYLVKPFVFQELLARIRALTRRTYESPANEIITIADLELNLSKKTVTRSGTPINLTAREFALLHYLMRNKERVVSRVDIIEQVWETSFDTGSNVIDVYINFLRKKIDKDFNPKLIHTLVGMGYVLKES